MDLLVPTKVTGIITQGAKDFGHVQFVGSYKVAYSNDGERWNIYQDEKQGKDKVSHYFHSTYWQTQMQTGLNSPLNILTEITVHTSEIFMYTRQTHWKIQWNHKCVPIGSVSTEVLNYISHHEGRGLSDWRETSSREKHTAKIETWSRQKYRAVSVKNQVLSMNVSILGPVCCSSLFLFSISLSGAQTEVPGLSCCLSLVWDQIRLGCQPDLASAMLKILFTALQQSTHVHSNCPQQQRWHRTAAASLADIRRAAGSRLEQKLKPLVFQSLVARDVVYFSVFLCYGKISLTSCAYLFMGDVLTMEN